VRGFSICTCLYLLFFISVPLFFLEGCARHLQTDPASDQDIQFAASTFARYRQTLQDGCSCCLDAEADAAISVSGWFSDHTGKLSGYLQAMKPGNIKFVALNPLGQPILILVTDGKTFKSLNIIESKAYMGSTESETFKKFAPPGYDPKYSFYWLTGAIPVGDIEIQEVSRDREDKGFWLQIQYGQSSNYSMILFDPVDLVVLRHIMMNDKGDHLVDLVYDEYRPENLNDESCRIPTKISISSVSGVKKKMDLKLFSFIPDPEFSPTDFDVKIPDNFEQLLVK
jgi:outer membrane lipoprotein-sorting protein